METKIAKPAAVGMSELEKAEKKPGKERFGSKGFGKREKRVAGDAK